MLDFKIRFKNLKNLFIYVFREFVDDDKPSENYKFHILRTSLLRLAADSISDISFESNNYKTALARLEERFNNKVSPKSFVIRLASYCQNPLRRCTKIM